MLASAMRLPVDVGRARWELLTHPLFVILTLEMADEIWVKGWQAMSQSGTGRLLALNTCDLLEMVGEDRLEQILRDCLAPLGLSGAVYKVNGDYAALWLGSDYCRMLYRASRARCDAGSEREALASGQWLCHESHWRDAARLALDSGGPVDLSCHGGIHVRALPILVDAQPIGALSFACGAPPTDGATLRDVAARYQVDPDTLRRAAVRSSQFSVNVAQAQLQVVASLITETYLRHKAERAAERRRTEIALMGQVQQALSQDASLEQVLQLVAEGAQSLFHGASATVYLLDEERHSLLVRNWTLPASLTRRFEQLTGLSLREVAFPLTQDLHYWQVVQARTALLLDDPLEIEQLIAGLAIRYPPVQNLVPAIVRLLDYCSVLIAPLLAGERVVGVMDLGSRKRLSEVDRRCFERLTAWMGFAIEHTAAKERERKGAQRLDLVHEIGRQVGVVSQELETLLQEAAETIQARFGYHDVLVALVDYETDELVRLGRAGMYDDQAAPRIRKLITPDLGILDWVAIHGETVLANDVGQDPRYWRVFPETRAELCVPIRRGGKVLGVLNVDDTEVNAFGPEDVMFMETLADELAAAIESARLHTSSQEHSAQLQAANQQLLALQEVTAALGASLDLEQVLCEVDRGATRMPEVMGALILLVSPEEQSWEPQLSVAAWADVLDKDVELEHLGGPVSAEERLTKMPHLVTDFSQVAHIPGVRSMLTALQPESLAFVPLLAAGETVGIVVLARSTRQEMVEPQWYALNSFASAAGLAVQRACLFKAEQQRAAEMLALHHLGVTLVTERDPMAIVDCVLDQLGTLLDVDVVTLGVVVPSAGSTISPQAGSTSSPQAGSTSSPQASSGQVPATSELRAFGRQHDTAPFYHAFALDGPSFSAFVVRTGEVLSLTDLETAHLPVPGVRDGDMPCAWLGVPLRVADRVTGCLSVQAYQPAAFGAHKQRLLTQVAAQVAPVLENARLLEETRHRLAREEQLNELAHTLGGEMNLDMLIPRLLPPVVQLTGADASTVAMFDVVRQMIVYPFYYNLPQHLKDVEVPAGSGISGETIARGEPVLLADYGEHPAALQPWVEAGVRSVLSVPLQIGDDFMGALLLFSLDEVQPFGEQALTTAQAAGRLASVALQRAGLFEAERQRRQEAEALREISLALSATLDAEQVMEVLLDQIGRVIPYDSANVMLIEGDRVRVTHIRGYERSGTAQEILGASLPLYETSHFRQMLTCRRPCIIPDTRSDPGWVHLEQAERVRSWAGAPIVVRDEVIGFLSLDNETPNFYSAEHAESLVAFASHVAVAVENARVYQLIQDHAMRLEELVRERTAELQTERDRTQAILDSAAEGVVVTDLQGHIQYVNPTTERLTGYTAPELLGQNPRLWRSGRHSQSLYQEMWETILSGRTWEGEVVNKRKGDALYDAVLTIAPIPGPDEEPVGFVGMLTDISRLKELDRMKDQFVSNVSHELRTPLTNLKLYLNLLEQGRPEKRERYMDTLQREATRLQQLIEDLLNLSRLDVGNVQLSRMPTDLNPLVHQLVEDRKLLAANRQLTLKAVLDPNLPPVLVDAKMFDQVITNLMSNAINYTPDGGEIVICTAEALDQGRRWVTVSVTDSGYGIPRDEQKQLFERFYRGRAARQTGVAGTGLGLSICREIVKRHAGRISVQSPVPAHDDEEGRLGAQFTVWLPVA